MSSKPRAILSFLIVTVAAMLAGRGPAVSHAADTHYLYLPVTMGNTDEVTIPETTEVLTDATLQHLDSVSADGSVFRFDARTVELENLDVGDVMVGNVSPAAPNGFLRKVTTVTVAGNNVTVITVPATLEDAVENGGFSLSHTFTPADLTAAYFVDGVSLVNMPTTRVADGFRISIDDLVLHDEDGNPATKSDQIRADGEFEVSPGFDFDVDVRNRKLRELEVVMKATEVAEIEVHSEIEKQLLDKEILIGHLQLGQFTAWIGYVPVVVTVDMPIYINLEGKVAIGLSLARVTQTATLQAGVRYDGDWDPIGDFDNRFDFGQPDVKATLEFKAYINPTLRLRLYGVAGPYVAPQPFMEFKAEYLVIVNDFSCTLHAGLEVPVGVEIEVLGHSLAKYEGIAIQYRIKLADCNLPPYAPTDPVPSSGSTGHPTSLRLSWNGPGDPNNDPVTYDVYIEDKPGKPGNRVCDNVSVTFCDVSGLSPNTVYHWQVIAEDDGNLTTEGPIWQFTTGGGQGNNPPHAPSNPSPVNNAQNVSTNTVLGWKGGDPDGDSVTYDVLLNAGLNTPTTLICDDSPFPTCTPSNLNWDTVYSWQVIARDEHGLTASSPVWRFQTRQQPEPPATMDIVLIIDSSGSMSSTDPRRLRIAGAQVFVDTMVTGDYLGVVGFASSAYEVLPLHELGPNRQPEKDAISGIGQGGSTNIRAALDQGFAQLTGSPNSNPKAAVLLTDGHHNVGSMTASSYQQYASRGWPIFTIGLSNGADENLLRAIASQTGGQFYSLQDANQLIQIYFAIQAAVSGSSVVVNTSFNLQQGQTRALNATIGADQNTANFASGWQGSEVDMTLKAPDGRLITPAVAANDPDIYHSKGATHELYRINYPQAGQWSVEVYGKDLPPGGEEITVQVSQRDNSLPSHAWFDVGPGSASGGGISQNTGDSTDAAAAVAPDGQLYVAWSDDSSGDREIYVKRWNGNAWAGLGGSDSGGGISNNSGASRYPTVAIGADGRPLVAWHDDSGGDEEIYIRRWSGSAWVEIGSGSASGGGVSNNSGRSVFPDLAVAPDGKVVIVWMDRSSGNDQIYLRRWDGNQWAELGGNSATSGGISASSGRSGRPALALDTAGRPYVAWADSSGSTQNIYAKRYNGSSWVEIGSGSASGNGLSQTSGSSQYATLALDGNNRPYVAWYDGTSGSLEIYAKYFDGVNWVPAGSGAASGLGISQTGQESREPNLAIAGDNTPYIVWEELTPNSTEVFVRRKDNDFWAEVGPGSATGQGLSRNSGDSDFPVLTFAPDGTLYTAWSDNTSGNFEIYVRQWRP
jgi:hypothetical protein